MDSSNNLLAIVTKSSVTASGLVWRCNAAGAITRATATATSPIAAK